MAEALLAFPEDVPVEVIGDCAYVIDCFRKEWHVKWEQQRLAQLLEEAGGEPRRVGATARSLAGAIEPERPGIASRDTAGKHPWNELADTLAVEAKGQSQK